MSHVLAHYDSKSKPGSKGYDVIRSGDEVYCNCPSWRFQKGKGPHGRRCKHLDDYWRKENAKRSGVLPDTIWQRLTVELFSEAELAAPPPTPKKKRKPKGAGATAWDRLNEEDDL